MATFTLDNLRYESRFVIRLVSRAAKRRVGTVCLILAICWVAGARWSLGAVVALIAASEVSSILIARRAPPAEVEVPLRLAAWMWTTNVASMVIYLGPALLLASRPELPFVLSGFLWLFGVYVHVGNTFVALPLHNWSQMVPGFGMGLVVVAAAALAHGPAAPLLWLIVAGLVVVYAVNTIQTITVQKDVQKELNAARADAKARLEALEALARTDTLTGLLNRQAFDAALERLLARRRAGREVAVLLIDLDGFKPINDTYSHAAGDAVLLAAARRLRAQAGEAGIVARLGGDEFAIAIPDVTSPRAALDLAARVARDLDRPIGHEGLHLRVSGSVGIAVSSADATDRPTAEATRLSAAADQAMLRAKAQVRLGAQPRAVLFDPAAFPARHTLDERERLAKALAAREVRADYKPVVNLSTCAVLGFKAVPIWHLPGEERRPAESFLPLVAEFGLQGDYLAAMVGQVLADVDGLIAGGLDPGRVSLNVPEMALATRSGRRELDRLLAAHPAARPHLVVEIAEEGLTARASDMVRDGAAHLRRLGVEVAVDGFGSGHASFRLLERLGMSEIRIDAALVAELGRDLVADTLVQALVRIGQGLGTRVVAAGVATEEQRRHLLRLGCHEGQGPLFARPAPLAEARLRLQAEGRLAVGPAWAARAAQSHRTGLGLAGAG